MTVKSDHRLLFDVTGLMQWYGFFSQPSGIQRVTERLLSSRPIRTYPQLICVARPLGSPSLFRVDAATVAGLCEPETRAATIARIRAYLAQGARLSNLSGIISDARYFDLPYVLAGLTRAESLVEGYFLNSIPDRIPPLLPLEDLGKRDIFFNPGDYWCHKTYARTVRHLTQSTQMRLGLLVHDLFALEKPEWSNPTFGPRMKEQFEVIAPVVDYWLATSTYVKNSLAAHFSSRGPANVEVSVLPMGGARVVNSTEIEQHGASEVLKQLGVRLPYILHVGTIEPRKNLEALLDALKDL